MKYSDHNRPRFGWANPEVEALFNTPTPHPSSSPLPSPSAGLPSPRPQSKSRVGAIAGGAVSGLIAILAGVVVWCLFSRGRTPDGPGKRSELPARDAIVRELPVGNVMVPELPVSGVMTPRYVEMYQPNMQGYPYNVY